MRATNVANTDLNRFFLQKKEKKVSISEVVS